MRGGASATGGERPSELGRVICRLPTLPEVVRVNEAGPQLPLKSASQPESNAPTGETHDPWNAKLFPIDK